MFDKRKESGQEGSRTQFDAGPDTSNTASSRTSSSRPAVIGAQIRINGDVTGAEDLVIDGRVEGKVDLAKHRVDIGQAGKVHADITAKVVRIEGEVRGDVNGSEKVTISRTGNVQGNIVAPRLTLEDGAKFKGSIDMDPGDQVSRESTEAVEGSAKRSDDKPAPASQARSTGGASSKGSNNGQGPVREKSKSEPGLSLESD